MQLRLVTLCAAALLLSCSAATGKDDEAAATRDAEQGCTPGHFGCTCTPDGGCEPGLECVDAVCELTEDSTGDSSAPSSACGWNRAAGWYDCGFSGPDPGGEFPLECPAQLELEDGAACPQALPFEGCCDAQGDLWYCDELTIHTPC